MEKQPRAPTLSSPDYRAASVALLGVILLVPLVLPLVLPLVFPLVLPLVLPLQLVLGANARLFLGHGLLSLSATESLHPIHGTRHPANLVCNLTTSDKADYDTSTNDKGEDKSVDGVPRRGPASVSCSGVGVVQECEGHELGDEGVFRGHQHSWPCDCRCDNSNGVAAVTVVTAVSGEFQTPMDGTKEGQNLQPSVLSNWYSSYTDHSAVADLQWLQDVEKVCSSLCRHEISVAGDGMIDLVGTDDGG